MAPNLCLSRRPACNASPAQSYAALALGCHLLRACLTAWLLLNLRLTARIGRAPRRRGPKGTQSDTISLPCQFGAPPSAQRGLAYGSLRIWAGGRGIDGCRVPPGHVGDNGTCCRCQPVLCPSGRRDGRHASSAMPCHARLFGCATPAFWGGKRPSAGGNWREHHRRLSR